jgi:predicted hydrocarbon binding protein
MTRNYEFSWDLLGDIQLGRPNLGPMVGIDVYRLMQYCFRDVLEQNFGAEKADQLFFEAGKLAGMQFYLNVIKEAANFNDFIKSLQAALVEKKIGILRVESADFDHGKFILSIFEDLDCSGLPELDHVLCVYDEGFLAGLFEGFTGKKYQVQEVDCWCTGDRTCRFTAELIQQ